MKRLFSLFAVVLAVLAVPISANADGADTYTLPELYYKISFPSDWHVVTREHEQLPQVYVELGFDRDTLHQLFEERDQYLNALSADYTSEIDIRMFVVEDYEDFSSFNDWDDDFLTEMIPFFQESLEQATFDFGANFQVQGIYSTSDAKYIVFDFDYEDTYGQTYGCAYTTIMNRQAIAIYYYSCNGVPLTSAQKSNLRKIVDSSKFTEILENPNAHYPQKSIGSKAIAGIVVGGVMGLIAILIAISRHRSPVKKATNTVWNEPPQPPLYERMEAVRKTMQEEETAKKQQKEIKLVPVQNTDLSDSPNALTVSKLAADKIRHYKLLLDDGIITQEEFDAKRKSLLGL